MTPEAHFSNIPLGRYFLNEIHEVFPMLQWEYIAGNNGFVMWGSLTSTLGILVSHTQDASTAVLASHPMGMTVGRKLDLGTCSKVEAHEWAWDVMYAEILSDIRGLRDRIGSFQFSPPIPTRTDGFYHHNHLYPPSRISHTVGMTGDLSGGVYLYGADSDQLALTIMEQKVKAHWRNQQKTKVLLVTSPTQTTSYAAMIDPGMRVHVEILGFENVGLFSQMEKWLKSNLGTYGLIVLLEPAVAKGTGPAQLAAQFNLPVLVAGDLPGMTPLKDPQTLLPMGAIRAASEILVIERSGGVVRCFKSRTSDREGKRFLLV